MKKLFAVLLILLMVATVFAGCEEPKKTGDASATSSFEPPWITPGAEVFEFKSFGQGINNVTLLLEMWNLKQTSVVPQVEGNVSGNEDDQAVYKANIINLFSVDSNAPDFMTKFESNWGAQGAYVDLGAAGKLVDFNEYWDLLPDYESRIWGADKSGWEFTKKLMSTADGKMYALPKKNSAMAHYVNIVDYAFLETLGVDELPADWDEFYNLMLTSKTSKGNEIVVPWTTYDGSRHYILNPIANSYGIACNPNYIWETMNGEPFWPFIWEEYLMTLETLQEMVNDKLVQSSPTNSAILGQNDNGLPDVWSQNITNGTSYLIYERYETIPKDIQGIAPANTKWAISKVQPAHKGYKSSGEFFSPIGFSNIAIHTKLGTAFAERMCAFINYFSTLDGEYQYTFGIKDKSYKINSDGKVEFILYAAGKTTDIRPQPIGSGLAAADYCYGISLREGFQPYGEYTIYPDAIWDAYPDYVKVCQEKIDNNTAVYPGAWTNINQLYAPQDVASYQTKINNLAKLASDFTNDFLSGKKTSTAWKSYLQDLKDAGYESVYNLKVQQLNATMGTKNPDMPSQSKVNAARKAAGEL